MEEVEGAKSSRSQKGGGDTSPTNPNRHPVKSEVCAEVLKRLAEAGAEAVAAPGFAEDLQAHFNRLPTRYDRFYSKSSTYRGYQQDRH